MIKLITKIRKRNGELVDFDIEKIKSAISRAFLDTKKELSDEELDLLINKIANKVMVTLKSNFKEDCVDLEDIQDTIELELTEAKFLDVAKSYVLYRKDHERIRETKKTLLDYKNVVDNYLKVSDWRVKENATVTYSVGGLILSNSGAITANYWLSEIYDKEIADAHRNADIHIHDLAMLTGYCAGWNLKQLITEGLGGVPGKITSSPANHLSTLCNQMVNFLGIMQNEWAGEHVRRYVSFPFISGVMKMANGEG